jgi:hypothetical protein
MPRIRAVIVLSALVSLVIAGTALAVKVTGGTTTLTPSSAASTLLSNNHITLTPIAPATASTTGAITFPIAGGRLDVKTLHGALRDSGGLQLSNGTKTVTLRVLRVISDKAGATIWAIVRDHTSRLCSHLRRRHARIVCVIVTRLRVARIATITGGSVTGSQFTGTVDITQSTAALINKLAGSAVVSAGAPFGTVTIAPTLS